MVVQHNMQAANANRMFGQNVKAVAKSSEKLSSGYKVNRAADDAAGLSISAFNEACDNPRICFLIFSEIESPAASSAALFTL